MGQWVRQLTGEESIIKGRKDAEDRERRLEEREAAKALREEALITAIEDNTEIHSKMMRELVDAVTGRGGMAFGGKVPGAGRGDIFPAMLEPGEYVIRKAMAKKYMPLLRAINAGGLPGFQLGGEVPKGPCQDPGILGMFEGITERVGGLILKLEGTLDVEYKRLIYSLNGTIASRSAYQEALNEAVLEMRRFLNEVPQAIRVDDFRETFEKWVTELNNILQQDRDIRIARAREEAPIGRGGELAGALGVSDIEVERLMNEERLTFNQQRIDAWERERAALQLLGLDSKYVNNEIMNLEEERTQLLIEEEKLREKIIRDNAIKQIKYARLTGEIVGSMFAAGWTKGWGGVGDALKEGLKSVLMILLDNIRKQIYLAYLKASIDTIFALPLGLAELAKIAVIETGYNAIRASVLAMAEGGIVTRPQIALIGEAGPEAVIPLDKASGLGMQVNVQIDADMIVADDESVVRTGRKLAGAMVDEFRDRGLIGQDEKFASELVN